MTKTGKIKFGGTRLPIIGSPDYRAVSKRGGITYLWGILLLLFFLPSPGYGFSASAQVDQTRISPGEAVSLTVIVDGGKGEVDLSSIQDFEILSSGARTSRSYVNGKWSHKVSYQYMLMPRKTGVLKIPELAVVGKGQRTLTREIAILVSENLEADDEPISFFARASLGVTEVVLGQQTVYTLKLYAARQFSGASFDPPGFKGLMARELTGWKKYTQILEGQTFTVNEIKYLIQGETTGTFDIAPAIFVAQKPIARSRKKDPFNSFFNDSLFNTPPTKPVRVVSNPVTLEIVPLPEYKGDSPFSGLVGQFTITTALDKHQIRVGQSATLTITIQGQGNIMDAGVPPLDLSSGQFKVYEDTPVEDIRATEKGFIGKKIFKQALVPGEVGAVTLPPLALTYFDVTTNAYRRISTEPIQFDVIPGEPARLVESDTESLPALHNDPGKMQTGGQAKQAVVMHNQDILDIREDISAIVSDNPLSLPWFFFWVLLPGAGFGCFTLFLQFKAREKTDSEQSRTRAKKYLLAAQKVALGSVEFQRLIHSALTAAVLSQADKRAESLTREEAKDILSRAGAEDSDTVIDLMDTLDAARFGGAGMDEKTASRCLFTIQGLIKTLVLVVCLFLAPAIFPGSGHAADTAGMFVDATRAYQAEDYGTAVEKFKAVAALGVSNPALFYNLGNAYLKFQDLGRAILWYERARRLAPNDPDLRFNLAHAHTRIKDRTDTLFTPMDILFFWKGLISLKWLQAMSIGVSFVFFAWAGTRQAVKRKVFNGAGSFVFILLCVLVLATGLEALRLNSDQRAVILEDTVSVRSGTMETATPLFDLHAGTRVRVIEKKSDHLKIRFSRGKVGWVSMDEAEII